MIAVIQRVTQASVAVDQKIIGQIKKGYLVLLGVVQGDTDADLHYLVKKISGLRIMADQNKKMNLNLQDAQGEVLVVSQFTLAGNLKKGNRPSFVKAAQPQLAQKYYLQFIDELRHCQLKVETGQFGGYMELKLINDGPTTIIIDSQKDLMNQA